MSARVRRFWRVLAVIAATVTVGATGYIAIDDFPLLDAVYLAVMTMTTVGYGEIRPLSQAGRLFNIGYMLLSVSVLLFTIGVMTQTVLEVQIGALLGRRREKKMIDKLKGHYVVCGFGRLGRGAAEEIKGSGVEVVVVDRREDRVEWARRLGYHALEGDSTRDDVLKEAGVERAAGLIAALATDADNLFAVISAKGLNTKLRVGARAAEEEAEKKMRAVGADSVLAPYKLAGTRLAQSVLKPHVHQFLDFASTSVAMNVRMEQLEVGAGSDLVGKSLSDLRLRAEFKVIVLAIRRSSGEMVFNPPAEAAVQAGDFLVVMGEPEPLRRLEARVGGVAV